MKLVGLFVGMMLICPLIGMGLVMCGLPWPCAVSWQFGVFYGCILGILAERLERRDKERRNALPIPKELQ